MPASRSRHLTMFRRGLLWVAVLGMLGAAVFYRQLLIDGYHYLTFQPSPGVTQLAEATTMKGWGKFYYLSARPQLESAAAFNADCRQQEPGSAVLGCYRTPGGNIFIYDVTNDELSGIREVTAAHEMLHAAYDRLSAAQKNRLTPLLEQAYRDNASPELRERMSYYERAEPGARINELHSIVGTEMKQLPSELERYYGQYFARRQTVVSLYERYQAVFERLQKQADQLQQETTRERTQLDADIQAYEAAVGQLNRDVEAFNRRAENGDFSSQGAFDAERQQLMARSSALGQREAVLKNRITAYNEKVDRLTALGEQAEKLNNSIDSTKAPQ